MYEPSQNNGKIMLVLLLLFIIIVIVVLIVIHYNNDDDCDEIGRTLEVEFEKDPLARGNIKGSGTGQIIISKQKDTIKYNIFVEDLSSEVKGVELCSAEGKTITELSHHVDDEGYLVITGSKYTSGGGERAIIQPEMVDLLFEKGIYIIIKTANYLKGELKGYLKVLDEKKNK